MNYLIWNKWLIFLGAFSLLGSFVFYIFNSNFFKEETFLINEHMGELAPQSLTAFNFKSRVQWMNYFEEGDLFDCQELSYPIQVLKNDNESLNPDELIIESPFYSIQLNGWAKIKEKMFFVFSSIELNTSFVGSVGDSFQNPDFEILSFDFKIIESNFNKYSVPLVTIIDKQLNERVILTPASHTEHL